MKILFKQTLFLHLIVLLLLPYLLAMKESPSCHNLSQETDTSSSQLVKVKQALRHLLKKDSREQKKRVPLQAELSKEKKTQSIMLLEEILQTEQNYYQCLKEVWEAKVMEEISERGRISQENASLLSDSLKALMDCHETIQQAIEQQTAKGHCAIPLGYKKAFAPRSTCSEAYHNYLRLYRIQKEIIYAGDRDEEELLLKQKKISACGVFDLNSILIKPIQRLGKYPLFFRSLIKEQYCSKQAASAKKSTERLLKEMNSTP
ncbi:MAG: hypothetical protein HQK50_14945 [Oligoflexia bacterium]|nr:hypothetical protein [Oligoflexia bacterium]MBF0366869.1 hypothetical protein [Oligoflexia bacterium]